MGWERYFPLRYLLVREDIGGKEEDVPWGRCAGRPAAPHLSRSSIVVTKAQVVSPLAKYKAHGSRGWAQALYPCPAQAGWTVGCA